MNFFIVLVAHWFLVISGANMDTIIIPMVSQDSCLAHAKMVEYEDGTLKAYCYLSQEGDT